MTYFKQKSLIMAIASALSLPLATVATSSVATAAESGSIASTNKTSPYLKADDTWISISGAVEKVNMNTFELDYGNGSITVEMDDGDRDADAYKLIAGDKVRVNGFIDDDFVETTSIEASSVHVDKIDTTFYASSSDEEDWVDYHPITTPVVVSETQLRGTVTDVDPASNEFVLDSGLQEMTIDVTTMANDPLDDEGYQRIDKGDLVSVTGDIDTGFFENRELQADSVITLDD